MKLFRVQEHCLRSSYGIEAENWLVTNDNHSVVLNDKAEAHMVANMGNDVINEMNALHEENQDLKNVLGNILLEVRRDITNTNVTGEVKVFINPNSFKLISEVLKKYGALKEWYE